MSRTKPEVLAWLDSKAGSVVPDKSDARLNGQCVALVKGLMEFLGVPNPYAARGNAKDAGDTYIRQGIGTSGIGWLTICVNRSMGGGYGHIWIDLKDEANFEQNGAIALHTTKNTRPWNQGVQYINLDKWLLDGVNMDKIDKEIFQILFFGVLERNGLSARSNALNGSSEPSDYIGKDLSAAIVKEIFYSKEAKDRRDGSENTFATDKNINKRLTERDKFEKENISLKKRIKELESQGGNYSIAGDLFGETYYRKNK